MGTERFAIQIFFPDGASPESAVSESSSLFTRWMSVCEHLLTASGPVIDQDLGGSLSHFHVRMGGPVGELMVHGRVCFYFAVSLGTSSGQDRGAVDHFTRTFSGVCAKVGRSMHPDCLPLISSALGEPTMLIVDPCDSEIEADQKSAIFQFGHHLVAAYLHYCEKSG